MILNILTVGLYVHDCKYPHYKALCAKKQPFEIFENETMYFQ